MTLTPGVGPGAIQGAGFRVELEPSQDHGRAEISQEYLQDDADDFGEDETRVEAGTNAKTTLDGFVDEVGPSGEADVTQDHRVASTPFDGDPTQGERLPSFGSAAAALEARLADIGAEAAAVSDTMDASERDPISLSGTSDTTITPSWSGDDFAPVAFVDPAISGPVLVPELMPPLEPAPVTAQPQLRFGLSAVLAALGVGVSLGMVLGLVLALVAFDRTTDSPSEPGRVIDLGD